MILLMTKQFSKWAYSQNVDEKEFSVALKEVQSGKFEANLGGYLYKKRIRFKGKGKSGSARTIICYKKDDRAIFIHGFAKNEKSNLSKKEFLALKEFSKILFNLSAEAIKIALENGDFIEVKV
jgi:hypothetical protein